MVMMIFFITVINICTLYKQLHYYSHTFLFFSLRLQNKCICMYNRYWKVPNKFCSLFAENGCIMLIDLTLYLKIKLNL